MHAFLLVLRGEECVEGAAFEQQAVLEAGFQRAVDGFAGGEDGRLPWEALVRPVTITSMARALPMGRVRRWAPPMPGMTPSLISGRPIRRCRRR